MSRRSRRPGRACLLLLAAPATLALAAPAHAAPGLGDEVYAATVEPGEFELETRYGVLTGGPASGEDNFRLEAGYGVNGHLRVAVVGEWEKAAGGPRQATHAGIEAVYHVARIGGIDVAAYGEYELGFHGESDGVEAKLLLQRRTRIWDLRLNLIAEKPLDATAPTEFAYATSADVAVSDNLRLGATAFGELGTGHRLFPYGEHYFGPSAKLRVPLAGHNLRIETGYLFAIAKARDDARGQIRLNLELEM
ncbi:MAG: hypothetical protein KGN34_09930 [Sphingomonadales bacterium]|nr:hypothetical protein [Sphingomonadales bacterium]